MSLFFNREVKVTAYKARPDKFWFTPTQNAIEIKDLRIQGQVEKNLSSEPDKARITISNCSEVTRAFLEHKPLIVLVEAGYRDGMSHLFTGDLRHGESYRAEGGYETLLELADGDRAYKHARVTQSYKAGVNVLTALKNVAAAFSLTLPAELETSAELKTQFAAGLSLSGNAAQEFTKLLAPFGFSWSIQNGRLVVIKNGETARGEVRVISSSTGMLDVPKFGANENGRPPTLTINHLLDAFLIPGKKIKVESTAITGFFKTQKVTHDFDTHGEPWFSNVEAKPI